MKLNFKGIKIENCKLDFADSTLRVLQQDNSHNAETNACLSFDFTIDEIEEELEASELPDTIKAISSVIKEAAMYKIAHNTNNLIKTE